MKLEKKELMRRVSDLIEDEETKISILEDLEDSIQENGTSEQIMSEEEKRDFEELKWKYEDLRNKYKERFLKGNEKEEIKETEEKENPEMEEKEIIDIREI